MAAVRFNYLSADLFALKQRFTDLETRVAKSIPEAEMDLKSRHTILESQVVQALTEFGHKFTKYDDVIHQLSEANTDLKIKLAEANDAIRALRSGTHSSLVIYPLRSELSNHREYRCKHSQVVVYLNRR